MALKLLICILYFVTIFITRNIRNVKARSELNMYMDESEIFKLFGFHADLFFIRDGVINSKIEEMVILALHDDLDRTCFTWWNNAMVSEDAAVRYEFNSYGGVNLETHLNISSKGIVDSSNKQTWCVFVNCRDSLHVSDVVSLSFKFDLVGVSYLRFNIVKFCKPMTSEAQSSTVAVNGLDARNMDGDDDGDEEEEDGSASWTVLGVLLWLGCVATTLTVICVCGRIFTDKELAMQVDQLKRQKAEANHESLDDRSLHLHDRIMEMSVPRNRVRLLNIEMEGTFGRIWSATYACPATMLQLRQVIVKTVAGELSNPSQCSSLIKEGVVFYGLKHASIHQPLAVCIDDMPPMLIYPNQPSLINLKKFLSSCKVLDGVARPVTTQQVVAIALQIASALQFCHQRKILHNDVATRNCMVEEATLKAKICDTALSRDVFPGDYHCLGDNQNRPIKWMAPETIKQPGQFSQASDLWSFGVTIWEVTTLGQQPYADVDPFEMAAYLRDGYRLPQPPNCPDDLFGLIACCWAYDPSKRPTFCQLEACLLDFQNQLARYV